MKNDTALDLATEAYIESRNRRIYALVKEQEAIKAAQLARTEYLTKKQELEALEKEAFDIK